MYTCYTYMTIVHLSFDLYKVTTYITRVCACVYCACVYKGIELFMYRDGGAGVQGWFIERRKLKKK